MTFPVLNLKERIPWEVIAPHEAQALKNHHQTLHELADRGGLSWTEALFVLTDREWKSEDFGKSVKDAREQVLAICAKVTA